MNTFEKIWRCYQEKRLAHALLLVGDNEAEKKEFALQLTHALLCQQSEIHGKACGDCRSCYLFNANSHPDLMLVSPEEEGSQIGIDSIRDVVKCVNETAQQGGYRVIIINPATAMNLNAANALLKTLEEPTPDVLFILLSDQSARLPATIVSRCQKVIIRTTLQTFLNADLVQGLHALSQKKVDPLQLAVQLQEQESRLLLQSLLSWLLDLLRFKLTQDTAVLTYRDQQTIIREIDAKISQANLLVYIEKVQGLYTKLLGSFNFNRQLLLEDIFIKWVHYVSR